VTTTFTLDARLDRYHALWITKPDRVAHVNEVHAVAS
jgi:hypothetical protein